MLVAPEHAVLVQFAGMETERLIQCVAVMDKEHLSRGVAVDDDASGVEAECVHCTVLVEQAQRQGGYARFYLQRTETVVVEEIIGAGTIDTYTHNCPLAGFVVYRNHITFKIDILEPLSRVSPPFVCSLCQKYNSHYHKGNNKYDTAYGQQLPHIQRTIISVPKTP